MLKKYKKIQIDKVPLEENFPSGLFDDYSASNSGNALQVLRDIDYLIKENSSWNLYMLRNWLQQSNGYRKFDDEKQFYDIEVDVIEKDFISQVLKSITPNHYKSIINQLDLMESEIILKIYFYAHQLWGKPNGVLVLIKSLIEYRLQKSVKVEIKFEKFTKKEIDNSILTKLKLKNSMLGQNFIIGKDFAANPETINVKVGPINYADLNILQNSDYAYDVFPTDKIMNIARLCEPYYYNTKVDYIIDTEGFILGKSRLGNDKLGLMYK